jgi:hypothetical protein
MNALKSSGVISRVSFALSLTMETEKMYETLGLKLTLT